MVPAALQQRAEEHRAAVEATLVAELGHAITITLVAGTGLSEAGRPEPAAGGPSSPDLPPEPEHENDIDLSELTDAPTVPRMSGIERVAAAFPGAQLMDEDH